MFKAFTIERTYEEGSLNPFGYHPRQVTAPLNKYVVRNISDEALSISSEVAVANSPIEIQNYAKFVWDAGSAGTYAYLIDKVIVNKDENTMYLPLMSTSSTIAWYVVIQNVGEDFLDESTELADYLKKNKQFNLNDVTFIAINKEDNSVIRTANPFLEAYATFEKRWAGPQFEDREYERNKEKERNLVNPVGINTVLYSTIYANSLGIDSGKLVFRTFGGSNSALGYYITEPYERKTNFHLFEDILDHAKKNPNHTIVNNTQIDPFTRCASGKHILVRTLTNGTRLAKIDWETFDYAGEVVFTNPQFPTSTMLNRIDTGYPIFFEKDDGSFISTYYFSFRARITNYDTTGQVVYVDSLTYFEVNFGEGIDGIQEHHPLTLNKYFGGFDVYEKLTKIDIKGIGEEFLFVLNKNKPLYLFKESVNNKTVEDFLDAVCNSYSKPNFSNVPLKLKLNECSTLVLKESFEGLAGNYPAETLFRDFIENDKIENTWGYDFCVTFRLNSNVGEYSLSDLSCFDFNRLMFNGSLKIKETPDDEVITVDIPSRELGNLGNKTMQDVIDIYGSSFIIVIDWSSPPFTYLLYKGEPSIKIWKDADEPDGCIELDRWGSSPDYYNLEVRTDAEGNETYHSAGWLFQTHEEFRDFEPYDLSFSEVLKAIAPTQRLLNYEVLDDLVIYDADGLEWPAYVLAANLSDCIDINLPKFVLSGECDCENGDNGNISGETVKVTDLVISPQISDDSTLIGVHNGKVIRFSVSQLRTFFS